MRNAVLCCALAGCAYKPGSFAYSDQAFAGTRASVGCLDVAVQRRPDLPIGSVLAYEFANRCDHAVPIDLARVRVRGRTMQGVEVDLRPYDPRGELKVVELDGRTGGHEALAYPADRLIPQVCVDVATLAGAPSARWLCLGDAGPEIVGSVP